MTLQEVAHRYAVSVSPQLLSLVDSADPNDPIARQFLPSLEELKTLPEELADPIGDAAHSPVPGIVHRHCDRVLFKVVAACPVYCRSAFAARRSGRAGERCRRRFGRGAGLSPPGRSVK
jgi:lysine 2,3-aminomutase